jgi:hypothetical protein
MSVLVAVGVLLLVLLLVDLALTAGIIRRLRGDAIPLGPRTNPRRGFRVSLERDGGEWPSRAAEMVSGQALVAFVMKDCPGCERLRQQIELAEPLPVPFYVVGDPTAGASEELNDYLASWPADAQLIAPQPIDLLDSFGRPDTYPTLVLLSEGVVRASGHRMDDVAESMAELGVRPLTNNAGR